MPGNPAAQIVLNGLDLALDAETSHVQRQLAVNQEALAAVAVVGQRQHAVVESHGLGRRPDVPLADGGVVIAGGSQGLGQGRARQARAAIALGIFGLERGPVRVGSDVVVDQLPVAGAAVLPRYQRRARRHAYGIAANGRLEAHALGGEAIDIGGADCAVAVAAHLEGAELVALADDDIGTLHGLSPAHLPDAARPTANH